MKEALQGMLTAVGGKKPSMEELMSGNYGYGGFGGLMKNGAISEAGAMGVDPSRVIGNPTASNPLLVGPMLAQLIGTAGDPPPPPPRAQPMAPPPQPATEVEGQIVTAPPMKKRTTLGTIADVLSVALGGKQHWQEKTNQENLVRAFETLEDDPLDTIKTIARIPGMQGQAWNMYNQYMDNKRADGQAGAIVADREFKRREAVFEGVASMLGAANEQTYSKIRERAERYAASRGVELPELPEVYDADEIAALRYSAVPVDRQMDDQRDEWYKGERLRDYDRDAGDRNARHRQSLDRGDARVRYVQDRQDARQGRSLAARPGRSGPGAGSIDLSKAPKPRRVGDRIKAKNGVIFISKDGKTWSKE